jgi:hypothetical protein
MKRSGIQDSFTKLSTAHINRPKWRKPTSLKVDTPAYEGTCEVSLNRPPVSREVSISFRQRSHGMEVIG